MTNPFNDLLAFLHKARSTEVLGIDALIAPRTEPAGGFFKRTLWGFRKSPAPQIPTTRLLSLCAIRFFQMSVE